MYLSYYQLNKKPFQNSSDPDFLWLGEKHHEALSTLKYGVLDNRGFLLLTGDVGTGKTTLKNSFVNSLDDDVIVAQLSNPSLTKIGLTKRIAEMFGIDTTFETKDEFLSLFTTFLNQAYADSKKILLIIDEAQLLTDELLEEIRLLSNIERQSIKLLNIFFIGQNEFKDTLDQYENRAVRQRITVNFTLDPFEPEETRACIEHRLQIAGGAKEIFSSEAIDTIHQIADGYPRLINIICDQALILGVQQKQQQISGEVVRKCANDLHLGYFPDYESDTEKEDSANDLFDESDIPELDEKTIYDLLKKSESAFAEHTQVDGDDCQGKKAARGRWTSRSPFIFALVFAGILALYDSMSTINPIGSFLQKDLSAALATSLPEKSPEASGIEVISVAPSNQGELRKENGQTIFQKPIQEENEGIVYRKRHPDPVLEPEVTVAPPSENGADSRRVIQGSVNLKLEPISIKHKNPGAAIDSLRHSNKG